MNELALSQRKIIDGVFSGTKVPKKLFMAGLHQLEQMLLDVEGVTLRNDPNTPLTHVFAKGLYGRKIEIPAGYLLTTGIHAIEHIAIVSKGRCIVATEEGIKEYSAGDTIITEAGTKRAMFILEDLIWTTVHAIDVSTPNEAINMIEYKSWEDCKWLFG